MGRHAPRLMVSSADGEIKNFAISDEAWNLLKFHKGTAAVDRAKARAGLEEICRRHIEEAIFELSAGKHPDAVKLIRKLRKQLKPFFDFACMHLDQSDDATLTVKFALLQAIKLFPAEVQLLENERESRAKISLTEFNLQEIGFSLERALEMVETNVCAQEGQGYRLGEAFEIWLVEMQRYATERGIVASPWKNDDGSPSSFSTFLHKIHLAFPDRARPHKEAPPEPLQQTPIEPTRRDVAGPAAMAKQLERALQERAR